jgi:menaquinone-9 beta-reductase
MPVNRPDTDSLDIYLRLTSRGDQLPGYAWVFPLGSAAWADLR